jgi:hypothetical protein
MIDITFDFRSDTPPGKDPDTFSPTLRRYHQLLWSKPLPSGELFDLDVTGPPYCLHHRSELGEFWLSSDAVVPSFSWLALVVAEVPEVEREEFKHINYTIGGMMIFPANRVDGKMTINGARGFRREIRDRFDLTLECIRRHYLGEPSPLSDTLARYADFFELFENFAGYVQFFHLEDLVDENASAVRFFMPFADFTTSPLPGTVDAYRGYRQRAIGFVESRNRRIVEYIAENPPVKASQPVWATHRMQPVLTHADAVGHRAVLEELLAASDQLGLYPRPYAASVMFTPPTNKTRMLFTVRPDSGGLRIWVSADTFEEFFPEISADEARRQLGPDGERHLDPPATREFIAGLGRLLHQSSPQRRQGSNVGAAT